MTPVRLVEIVLPMPGEILRIPAVCLQQEQISCHRILSVQHHFDRILSWHTVPEAKQCLDNLWTM